MLNCLMSTQTDTANIPWDTLAQSIADGEAVLILGPDALFVEEETPTSNHE